MKEVLGLKQDELMKKRDEFSAYAQVIRNQNHLCRDDLMVLAKILSRQAQLEMQLAILGVTVISTESPIVNTDEGPF